MATKNEAFEKPSNVWCVVIDRSTHKVFLGEDAEKEARALLANAPLGSVLLNAVQQSCLCCGKADAPVAVRDGGSSAYVCETCRDAAGLAAANTSALATLKQARELAGVPHGASLLDHIKALATAAKVDSKGAAGAKRG